MISLPLISVVLPTHNRRATLERAIGSVLAQTLTQIELIVVDDGSTDGTADFLRASIKDPRVRIVTHADPLGPGAARNAGVRAAQADWIAFQDSDDAWWPQKLERQWQHLARNPHLDFICCNSREFNSQGIEKRPRLVNMAALRENPERSLDGTLWFITPTWLIRKAALTRAGGFNEALLSAEDWELCFRLSDFARFDGVEEFLVDKFESAISVFNDPQRRHQGLSKATALHRHRWIRANLKTELSEFELRYARRMLASGWPSYAAIWAARAWRDHPLNLKALQVFLDSARHMIRRRKQA